MFSNVALLVIQKISCQKEVKRFNTMSDQRVIFESGGKNYSLEAVRWTDAQPPSLPRAITSFLLLDERTTQRKIISISLLHRVNKSSQGGRERLTDRPTDRGREEGPTTRRGGHRVIGGNESVESEFPQEINKRPTRPTTAPNVVSGFTSRAQICRMHNRKKGGKEVQPLRLTALFLLRAIQLTMWWIEMLRGWGV